MALCSHLISLIRLSSPPSTLASLPILWFLKHTVLSVFEHAVPPAFNIVPHITP